RIAAALAVGWATLHVPSAAFAHADPQGDRRVVRILTVAPPWPAGVVVQVRHSVTEQLVAENRTGDVLEVLGEDGRPFLRIGPNEVCAALHDRQRTGACLRPIGGRPAHHGVRPRRRTGRTRRSGARRSERRQPDVGLDACVARRTGGWPRWRERTAALARAN